MDSTNKTIVYTLLSSLLLLLLPSSSLLFARGMGGSEVGPGEDLPYISNMVCAAQGLEVVYREQARIPY